MDRPAQTDTDHAGNEYELRTIQCPICDRDDGRLLGVRGGAHQRYGLGFESQIYRCRECGLIYPNPLPVPKNPSEIYGDPEGYFSRHDMDQTQDEDELLVRELIRRTRLERPAVLDIGSGRGEVVAAAEKLGCSAVGLELSEPMIEDARKRLGVTVERATVEEYAASHPPDSFDAVVASAVIEHVYDPDS